MVITALSTQTRGVSARSGSVSPSLGKALTLPPAFVIVYLQPVGTATSHTTYCLKILLNPTANATDSACRGFRRGRLVGRHGVMLLGEGEQAGSRRKGRPTGRIREA